ncbi:MAG: hypothetical protein H7Z14_04755 [Anaerolineae bacterium]|nr:hypothetical protein [Phycisphaerae bacterium]
MSAKSRTFSAGLMKSCSRQVSAGRSAPHVESLERRQLLAGNVSVVGGENFTATITGDKKANSIDIRLSGTDGYLIRGLGGTKINGAAEVLLKSSISAFFNISLGKGNDFVSIVGPVNTQTVSILTGDGNDRVSLSQVSHFGDLKISTGKGKDFVALSTVSVTRALAIDTGADNDAIQFAAVQAEGNASVSGGKGKNTLTGSAQLNVAGAKTISALKLAKTENRDKDDDDDDDDD